MLAIVWIAVIVALIVIDVITANEAITKVSLFFIAGAFAALVLSLVQVPEILQGIVFFLIAGIAFFLLRPMIRKNVPLKLQFTNIEAIPGKYAPVTIAIDNVAGVGQIKMDGMEWSARSTDGQPIEEGTVVCVHHVEGCKAFVFPVAEEFTAE
ncbi:MAG: NfeD family protein [Oscillospiraceae bacterium]|nr:NfeD family protein [Oscillospiraceae bacterium]